MVLEDKLKRKVAGLERLHRVGLALGAEKDRDRLLELILIEAKELCDADGGTLYLRTDDDELSFAIMRNDSLDVAMGGTTGKPIELPTVPMRGHDGEPNHTSVASHCAHVKQSVNIPDAYDAQGYDFSGAKAFDEQNNYRSKSFLTIPMLNQEDRVIGVLQLINARDNSGDVVPFVAEDQEIAEALASQAAIALDNQMLLSSQRELMEAFIKLIAAAIDDKSPYTGGHCRRVPVLTEMIAESVCRANEGPFRDFNLTEGEWYELHIAGWLHDCGKVTTPVHVMDKATKLETIHDRIAEIRTRFGILRRDARIKQLEFSGGAADYDDVVKQLDDDLDFLEVANIGGEFMSDDKKARVHEIAKHKWVDHRGKKVPLLTEEEVHNLTISRGTLTDEERIVINGHMVQTIRMLEALPFPRHLKRVPEYAGGHHEKMDGSGYPKGIYGGDMSVPARIMAIADVFEALTAQDRPYKKGKSLSEAMKIMGFMKRDNHLDPELFDLFVSSGTYKVYADKYLPEELIDTVDEDGLLAVTPKDYELPPEDERAIRKTKFLAQYEATISR